MMKKEQNLQEPQKQILNISATVNGNCFWGHKWTKWELYEQPMIAYFNDGHLQDYIECRQRRTCIRCGYTQNKLIS